MTPSTLAAILYGVLAIVGGGIGYAQARSKVSLISGSISGVLLILCAILAKQGNPVGIWGAIAITVLLIGVFIGRYIKTRKAMPAILMIVAGIVALVVQVAV